MVVVDGRRPGYSVGMTNFELAQALVRLGAVNASALDGGGSSAMAFNGSLLSRPSNGEPATSTALQLMYYGVYAPTPDPYISPNGDGVAERQRALSYKVVRQSNVTATLVGPGNVPAYTETVDRAAGHVSGRLPAGAARSDAPARAARRGPVAARRDGDRRPRPDLDHEQSFTVNSTLGFAKLSRRSLDRPRPRQADRFRPASRSRAPHACSPPSRPSRACASPRSPSGTSRPGRFIARWKGTTLGGRSFVYGGLYKIRFRATQRARRRRAHDPGLPRDLARRRCRRRSQSSPLRAGRVPARARRFDPERDHRFPHLGRRRLRLLRGLPADGGRRRVARGERSGDGLRRRCRCRRVRRSERRPLRLGARARISRVPRDRDRRHGRVHGRVDRGLVDRRARGPSVPRAPRPLVAPEGGEPGQGRALVRALGGLGRLPRPDHPRRALVRVDPGGRLSRALSPLHRPDAARLRDLVLRLSRGSAGRSDAAGRTSTTPSTTSTI